MRSQRTAHRLEFVCRNRMHVADFVSQLIELQIETHHDVCLTVEGNIVSVGDNEAADTHQTFCAECRELFVESSQWRTRRVN